MKRFVVLAMVAAFVLTAAVASAELKVSTAFKANGIYETDQDFKNTDNRIHNADQDDKFWIAARLENDWRFTANENVSVFVRTRIGTANFGNGAFQLGASSTDAIQLRMLYLEFKWPNTDVLIRGGFQNVFLPNSANAGYGSIIMDSRVAAVQIVAPVVEDTVDVVVGYARAGDNGTVDAQANSAKTTHRYDEFDIVYGAVPLKFDGITLQPFFALGIVGNGSNTLNIGDGATGLGTFNSTNMGPALGKDTSTPWWVGAALDFDMIEDVKIGLDFNYGAFDPAGSSQERKGWAADFAVSYSGIDMLTPKLFFAYGSGDDDDLTNGSERMPTVEEGFSGNTDFIGGATTSVGDTSTGWSPSMGLWMLGANVDNITFMEDLSNSVKFGYIKGTNDAKMAKLTRDGTIAADPFTGYLTTKDYALEVDIDTKYMIYQELALILELSYSHLALDDSVWGKTATNTKDIYRGVLGLQASF